MEEQLLGLLIPGIGLVSGLIATYVSLQNRALLAEVRQELAEIESRILLSLNGKFVRQAECLLREDAAQAKLAALIAESHGWRGRQEVSRTCHATE